MNWQQKCSKTTRRTKTMNSSSMVKIIGAVVTIVTVVAEEINNNKGD